MKIGLQLAMPSEFRALPGASSLTPFETISGVDFYRFSPDIIACTGGVGKVNAAMAAEILCLKYGVDLILNTGVAGCFTDLPTTSVVVASELIQHDVDTTGVGDPIGLVSTVNRVEFPTWQPEHCVELLRRAGIEAVTGRVATSDAFLTRGERSQWVYDTFHPLLAEMTTPSLKIRPRSTTPSMRPSPPRDRPPWPWPPPLSRSPRQSCDPRRKFFLFFVFFRENLLTFQNSTDILDKPL